MSSEDNKRIAKNTLFLYMRMLTTIVVNLISIRILWNLLGQDDYGIYNIVGGIVIMFSFINSGMVAASQRYIAFELGNNNHDRLQKVFSISVKIHFILSLIILIIGESIGLWFLNAGLNIPDNRMFAANIVYQFSLFSFILTVISVPYNACIVAHEHMNVYGYLGIFEVILKFVSVLMLFVINGDKLIIYAILVFSVSLLMRIIYGLYCRKYFQECHYIAHHDKSLLKEMFSFAGWSLFGTMGFAAREQGLNFILNIWFGVAMNAAKSISTQVSGVLNNFAANIQMAIKPQIIKRYAVGDYCSVINLVCKGSKYSFLMVGIFAVPLYLCAEIVLNAWLGNVDIYTIQFLRITLFVVLIETLHGPIVTALQATGKVKVFQLTIGIIMLMSLPIAWIWLVYDKNPYAIIWVMLGTSIIGMIARLFLLRSSMEFSISQFFKSVILKVFIVISSCVVVDSVIMYFVKPTSIYDVIIFSIISVIPFAYFTWIWGLDNYERKIITTKIKMHLK